MKSVQVGFVLFMMGVLAAGCGQSSGWTEPLATPAAEPTCSSPQTGWILRVGSVSKYPKKEISTFQPLKNYLEEALRPYGAAGCDMVVCRSVEEMAQRMQKGEVDLYIDSAWPVARVCTLCGATPILRRWKGGEAEYRGVIFVRTKSGLTEVKQLSGRVIALDDPTSTSGYLLPLGALAEAGLRLQPVKEASDPVPEDKVGYVFAGDEENVFFWVLRDKAAAGAINEKKFLEFTASYPEQFMVIRYTPFVPRHVVCQRRDMDPAAAAAVRQALLEMDQTNSGRQALANFQKTAKFDEFPDGGDAALQPIRRAIQLLDSFKIP